MGKVRKGYDSQDGIIARFKRDARSSTNNSAVARAMRNSKGKIKPQVKDEIQFSPFALTQLTNG